MIKRQFVAYFYYVGYDCYSLGIHVCLSQPNVEIHLPFGFIRIGWVRVNGYIPLNHEDCKKNCFGLSERYT